MSEEHRSNTYYAMSTLCVVISHTNTQTLIYEILYSQRENLTENASRFPKQNNTTLHHTLSR